MKTYLSLIGIDLKLATRQRSVIFFNYLFPLIFFFTFAKLLHAERSTGSIVQVLAMVVALGALGNGLFGAGMRAIQERETNILRRYKVTPITPTPLLVASMVTGWMIFMPYILLVVALSHFLYGMAWPGNLLSLLVFISIGLIAFRAIGLVISSVANSMQEGTILVQLVYFPMMFLSGATFPVFLFSPRMQAVMQFIPASYMVQGTQGMLLRNETLAANWKAVGALLLTAVLGLVVGMKLFRWEKDEKIGRSAKLWIAAVLLPFIVMGAYEAHSKENIHKNRIIAREMRRNDTLLITGARIFVGDGRVIESGAVLVRNGKIAEVYEGSWPAADTLKADEIQAVGKTILPGLIDVHVHLGAPGGFYEDMRNYRPDQAMLRHLAAYLYSGVTTVKSVGDQLDESLKARTAMKNGEKLGAELFLCGPLFTTEGGHGTEYSRYMPETMKAPFDAQFLRKPRTPAEARQQVDELKTQGVDGVKAILDAGAAPYLFNRLDPNILKAISEEAHNKNLPVTVHTGEVRDVADALAANTNGIEHGSARDSIPDVLFVEMAKNGVAYDPTLSVFEAIGDVAAGKTSLLKRSLVQQVGPPELLQGTEKFLTLPQTVQMREGFSKFPDRLQTGQANLLRAYHAHVLLVTGSDAGNTMVVHGPTIQHELQLWVKAGIPASAALQAATYNAAEFLRAGDRIGSIKKGHDADLLIVEGNPLEDISAVERISRVFFKGEIVNRSELFQQQ